MLGLKIYKRSFAAGRLHSSRGNFSKERRLVLALGSLHTHTHGGLHAHEGHPIASGFVCVFCKRCTHLDGHRGFSETTQGDSQPLRPPLARPLPFSFTRNPPSLPFSSTRDPPSFPFSFTRHPPALTVLQGNHPPSLLVLQGSTLPPFPPPIHHRSLSV